MLNISQASVSRYIKASRQQISKYITSPDKAPQRHEPDASEPRASIYNGKTAEAISRAEAIALDNQRIAEHEQAHQNGTIKGNCTTCIAIHDEARASMPLLRFTQQLEKPSRSNIEQAFRAIQELETAGNYTEAEAIGDHSKAERIYKEISRRVRTERESEAREQTENEARRQLEAQTATLPATLHSVDR